MLVLKCETALNAFKMEKQKIRLKPEEVADILFSQGIKREEIVLTVLKYTIDKEGTLKNRKGNVVGKGKTKKYKRIQTRLCGIQKDIFVHKLQAFSKYGREIYKDGIVVRHLDGNPSNNSWDNIAIGTAKDNSFDIDKEIRTQRAIHASKKTIKYKNVEEIRKYHKDNGNSYRLTMQRFNISSTGTLSHILKSRKI